MKVGINSNDLRYEVVRKVLEFLEPEIKYSIAAENLILGTIAQESHNGRYLKQIKGPALGICQMEPRTHNDIWSNFIDYNENLSDKIKEIQIPNVWEEQLKYNLHYAVAMCRVHYLRVRERLPDANDIDSLGKYWKKYYNTYLGAGTVEEFKDNYDRFVLNG